MTNEPVLTLTEKELFSFSSIYWDEDSFNRWQTIAYVLMHISINEDLRCEYYSDLLESYLLQIHHAEKEHCLYFSLNADTRTQGRKMTFYPNDYCGYSLKVSQRFLAEEIINLNAKRASIAKALLDEPVIEQYFNKINLLKLFHEQDNCPTSGEMLGLSQPRMKLKVLKAFIEQTIASNICSSANI